MPHKYRLLVVVFFLTNLCQAQVYNLLPILSEKVDPVSLQDPQIHAINNRGVMLGSLESIYHPENRRLFLVTGKSGRFEITLLDEYPLCTPIDLSDDNYILMNAQLPDASKVQAYTLRGLRGATPQRVYGGPDQQSLATRIHGDQVALTVHLENLPDRSSDPSNPSPPSGHVEVLSSASKGMIASIHSGKVTPGGFPAAYWYNLNSTVTDFNAKGHYCGNSEGYTTGTNVRSPYPYLATKDSVYQLLDGYRGNAVAVNDRDQVIGTWKHPLTGREYGFFYDKELLNASEFDWLDMLQAIPRAINRDGVVVGQAQDTAFVMIEQEYVSKQTILPDLPLSWQEVNILDINDNLEIIGTAMNGTRKVLFYAKLLIPD